MSLPHLTLTGSGAFRSVASTSNGGIGMQLAAVVAVLVSVPLAVAVVVVVAVGRGGDAAVVPLVLDTDLVLPLLRNWLAISCN